jgi:hypothetical protein
MEPGSAEGVTARRFGRAGGGWIGTVAAVFLTLFALWLWCRNVTGSLIRITVVGGDAVEDQGPRHPSRAHLR